MKTIITALLVLTLATPSYAFDFDQNDCQWQDGDACKGASGDDGEAGLNGVDGKDGQDGINGADANPHSLAVTSALSQPVWLESQEAMSLSLGWGTAEGKHAIGLSGAVRLEDAWSLHGGIATDTGRNVWAGRAGVRVGW